jgi:hypothetical protein
MDPVRDQRKVLMMVKRDSKGRGKHTSATSCWWCLGLGFLWLEWDVRRVEVLICDFVRFLYALVLFWSCWLLLKRLCLENLMRSLKVCCLVEVRWVCKTLMETKCAALGLTRWIRCIVVLIIIIIHNNRRRFLILKGGFRIMLLLLFFLNNLMKLCRDLRQIAPLVNKASSL